MQKTLHINFEFELVRHEANVLVKYTEDNNYGADADGNRGTFERTIDEVTILGCINDEGVLVDKDNQALIDRVTEVVEDKL